MVLEAVDDQTKMMLSLSNTQSTADKADSDRKKLLTAIDQDGTLTQQAYADQCGFASQQVVSNYITWLRKEKHLKNGKGCHKLTKKGKAWCTEDRGK